MGIDKLDGHSNPVTVSNWLNPEMLGWSFQHVDEVIPTAAIPRGRSRPSALPSAPVDVAALDVALADGASCSVAEIVAATDTDGWLVLHRGGVVIEEYAGEMTVGTRHLLQSVSKSLVATVAGALAGQGLVDVEAPVTRYVPALADSGYAGATVRQVLDMRSGVAFSEEYSSPDSDSRRLEATAGWAPRTDDLPRTLKEYLCGVRQIRAHGGPFEYRSCETDVLGWVCESASDERFPELAADLLWSRVGAESDAYMCVDAEGTGVFDGGICVTLRDLVRFGATILADGASATGEQVVPTWWVSDIFTGGPDSAEAFAASPDDHQMPGGMYRSQFWFPTSSRQVALCIGIHGQLVYLNRHTGTVAVKLSSWPTPQDSWKAMATIRMFDAISAHLAA